MPITFEKQLFIIKNFTPKVQSDEMLMKLILELKKRWKCHLT